MKLLEQNNLPALMARIALSHELRLPITLMDGSRTIGSLSDGPVALIGAPILEKPTRYFFPPEELVFTANESGYERPRISRNGLVIIGFTPTDLQCLKFIDRFFSGDNLDDIYFKRREGAIIAAVSGYCGVDGHFINPAYGDCDLEFIYDGNFWLIEHYTAEGKNLVAHLPKATADRPDQHLNNDNNCFELIRQASRILTEQELPESFWEEIGNFCIQCTGCNLVCPTCTCFGMTDWRYADRIERKRMWDSCQLGGFMQEAGGHNPLGTATLRTRRRIHHKLAADPVKWGEIGCFACGRCDETCPSGIGMFAVAREIVKRFKIDKSGA